MVKNHDFRLGNIGDRQNLGKLRSFSASQCIYLVFGMVSPPKLNPSRNFRESEGVGLWISLSPQP